MLRHPDFSIDRSAFFAGRQIQFQPNTQARNLLSLAEKRGGEATVKWYRKVLTATRADMRVVSEIHGLLVEEAIELSSGVTLLPVKQLSESPQAQALKDQGRSAFEFRQPAAAVVQLRGVEAIQDYQASHKIFLSEVDKIRRTATAFTLSEKAAPTTGISWAEFDDPDLDAARLGYGWQSPTYDGRQPDWPEQISSDLTGLVEKYLALRGPVAKACDVALARLNLARRRKAAGDQAIEGGVCLEALLADSTPGDLTYKLKLRTALFLGGTMPQRRSTSALVGRFYSLRGKVVHGQSQGDSAGDRETAELGLVLCLNVLTKIVENASLPNLADLELSGGAPAEPLTSSTE